MLSETFLVAWRKMEEVPLGDEARPWLFKTARFVLMNRRRSVRSYSRTRDRLAVEVRHQLVELGHEDLLTTDHAVRDALNRLPFLEREVLVLTIWDELKPGEIAEVLELPGAAVRKHLFRARSAMRTILAGVLDEASSEIPKNTEQSRPSRHVHSEPFNPTPKRR